MLFRNDSSGYLAIGQPAHSWVSGQLARQWGNAQFGRVSPREEVCLAAEMHDLGFTEWEHDPSFLEGKHLLRPCREAAEMRAQFEAAAPVRIEVELTPNLTPESP